MGIVDCVLNLTFSQLVQAVECRQSCGPENGVQGTRCSLALLGVPEGELAGMKLGVEISPDSPWYPQVPGNAGRSVSWEM